MQKKAVLFLIIFCLVSEFIFSQTQTPVYLSQTISGANSKGFYQYLPADYSTSAKNYPLIIWVHGAGQLGQGNTTDLPKVLEWGVPKIISEGGFPASFTVGDSSFSFIILSPQFISWPTGDNVLGIINYAMSNYRVNPDRVYLIGISAGGGAVWEYASNSVANSNKLAAMIPFCGTLSPTQTLANRIAASNLPVWTFHNTNDGTVPVAYSRNWKNFINGYVPTPNPMAKLTEFPVVSSDAVIAHECWSLATLPSYKPAGINIYEWLLGYRKRIVTINLPPLASAGQDQGVVLPASAILDGSASADQDGIIVSYRWRKINGPASYSFSDSTAVKPTISNLVQGVYQFELSVADNLGALSKDSISLNVYASLPTGAQQRILIDVGGAAAYGGTITTSPSINGNVWNNMTDARPGIRVSNALTINNQLSGISIEVINRVDGTYSTSSLGIGNGNTAGIVSDYPASATTDHALIHSSATNGKWRIKGLQTNKIYTVKFWGTRSNTTAARNAEIKRADDNVWKTYSATNNTNYNNAAVFNITGKTEMDFDIRTKAGSDFSAINVLDIFYGSDTTITPPPPIVNLPPVARAGADTSIQLPIDSVILRGCSSTDPEMAALKYKWRKISGPTTYLIPVDTLCASSVKGLIAGAYSFELTVTDTAGLTGKDTLTLTVNALISTNWPAQVTPLCNKPYKIVVVGSSTAYGTGASPIDSSWVKKFNAYLQIQNQQIQVINIATLGLTSWDVSPTGTIVPFPFTVDTLRNITKALSLSPDAIILSLPSNDVARGVATNDIHTNYTRITSLTNSMNVPIWVTTTQPRDGLSPAERILQMDLRDWVNINYGNKSVDFWSTVANPDGTINSFYSAGDGVHLNNYGHHVLFTRIVEEKIWDTICKRNNLAPVAKAGNNVSINAVPAAATLNGSASYDPEGILLNFSWRIINNSNGILTASNTVNPVFTTSIAGVYIIELKVTDGLGVSDLDSIQINVNAPNIAPLANAGNDFIVQLPTDSTLLSGTASFDPDGSNLKFKWRKISGPTATIVNDSIAAPRIKNLLAGNYSFSLIVTDDSLAVDADTVNFIVNTAPVAIAGTDQTITLPNHTISLNGAASFDDDGNIVLYRWRRISGNGTITITDTNTVVTSVNFISSGQYLFELKVIDNLGAVAKDTISITINPDPNLAPVANAGSDQSLQMPANHILLDGRNSYDPEGTATTFNWALVSGPAGSLFITPNKDSTSVVFVNEGTYIFRLSITDMGGLIGTDDITVIVLAIPNASKKINVNIYGGANPFTNTQWNNWNIIASPTSTKFLYDDVSLSNINASITAAGSMADNGAAYASTATVCPPQVLRYNSYNSSIRTLTLTGLNTSKKYSLEFYASRASTGNSTVFQIGNSFDTILTSNNVDDFAKFQNISADVNGKITINISRIGTWNYLAGFRIIEQDPIVSFKGNSNLIVCNEATDESWKDKSGKENNKLSSYPNPFHNEINIQINDIMPGTYTLVLSDISGKRLLQKTVVKNSGAMLETIQANHLNSGTYLLQILGSNKTLTNLKLIKK
jgi:lysophospholipase L1-like esterase